MKTITQEQLKLRLEYNPKTGIFKWKSNINNGNKNRDAGYIDNTGYRRIRVNGKLYKASRLAWLYVYGYIPSKQIDHINGDRLDDSIENLREVTNRENSQNMKIHREGHLPGTRYHYRAGKWESGIKYNGRRIHIGTFNTKEEAHKAYKDYENKLITSEDHP